uniref:Uncharacterized protein n=1 Tax=Arundo donax TaxID=35708 RepID=A0A0A9AGK5_ARUDO
MTHRASAADEPHDVQARCAQSRVRTAGRMTRGVAVLNHLGHPDR